MFPHRVSMKQWNRRHSFHRHAAARIAKYFNPQIAPAPDFALPRNRCGILQRMSITQFFPITASAHPRLDAPRAQRSLSPTRRRIADFRALGETLVKRSFNPFPLNQELKCAIRKRELFAKHGRFIGKSSVAGGVRQQVLNRQTDSTCES